MSEKQPLMAAEDSAASTPTWLSRVQGPCQAWLRPGQWCFGVRAIRQGDERWEVNAEPAAIMAAVKAAVEKSRVQGLVGTRKIRIGKIDEEKGFVRLENYTATAEWLDCLELHVQSTGNTCHVYVKSFSSGFIPTCVPLAPLLSAVCCWIPFSDFGPQVSFCLASCLFTLFVGQSELPSCQSAA